MAKAITRLLPNEEIIYFGDTAHLPYGDKSGEAVQHFAHHITQFLLARKCKLIVIACNTASSVASESLHQEFGHRVIFVNVIDPIVKGVVQMNRYRDIGVIGTKGTISSSVYARKIEELAPGIRVHAMPTPLLAPMIEEGFFHNKISKEIIDLYLAKPAIQQIQALILACTHYPLIKHDIEDYYQGRVDVFDSTDFVAKEVAKQLTKQQLLNTFKSRDHHFFVSDYTDSFEQTTYFFYRETIQLELCSLWNNAAEFPDN